MESRKTSVVRHFSRFCAVVVLLLLFINIGFAAEQGCVTFDVAGTYTYSSADTFTCAGPAIQITTSHVHLECNRADVIAQENVNSADGIDIASSLTNISIDGCDISATAGSGIDAGGSLNTANITDNVLTDSFPHASSSAAIDIVSGSNLYIANNQITGNTYSDTFLMGIRVGGTTNQDISVEGNTLSGFTQNIGYGIELLGITSGYLNVSGNSIDKAVTYAIFASAPNSAADINDNTITNSGDLFVNIDSGDVARNTISTPVSDAYSIHLSTTAGGAGTVYVDDSTISGVTGTGAAGIYSLRDNTQIINNRVTVSSSGDGIVIADGATVVVSSNNVTNGDVGIEFTSGADSGNTISNNRVVNTATGIMYVGSASVTATISDNVLIDVLDGIYSSMHSTIQGNTIDGRSGSNRVGIQLSGTDSSYALTRDNIIDTNFDEGILITAGRQNVYNNSIDASPTLVHITGGSLHIINKVISPQSQSYTTGYLVQNSNNNRFIDIEAFACSYGMDIVNSQGTNVSDSFLDCNEAIELTNSGTVFLDNVTLLANVWSALDVKDSNAITVVDSYLEGVSSTSNYALLFLDGSNFTNITNTLLNGTIPASNMINISHSQNLSLTNVTVTKPNFWFSADSNLTAEDVTVNTTEAAVHFSSFIHPLGSIASTKDNFVIYNNSVYIAPTLTDFDVPANLTFYDAGLTGTLNAIIDETDSGIWQACLEPVCTNFQGSAPAASFDVSGFTTYNVTNLSIGVCGDGSLGAFEACDDWNTNDGDWCSADCQSVSAGGYSQLQSNAQRTGSATENGTNEETSLLWQFTRGSVSAINMTGGPIIENNLIYYPSYNGLASYQYVLYAINITTRDHLWNYSGAYRTSPIVHTPAYGNDALFFGRQNGVIEAINATTGSLIWSNISNTGSDIFMMHNSPIYDGGIVYFARKSDGLFALNATNGDLLWHVPFSDMGAGYNEVRDFAVGNFTIGIGTNRFDGANSSFFVFNKTTGDYKWGHNVSTEIGIKTIRQVTFYNNSYFVYTTLEAWVVFTYAANHDLTRFGELSGYDVEVTFATGIYDGYASPIPPRGGFSVYDGDLIFTIGPAAPTGSSASSDNIIYAMDSQTFTERYAKTYSASVLSNFSTVSAEGVLYAPISGNSFEVSNASTGDTKATIMVGIADGEHIRGNIAIADGLTILTHAQNDTLSVYGNIPIDNDGDGVFTGSDCDDTDPDLLPPVSGYDINRSIEFCPGSYAIADAIFVSEDNVTITSAGVTISATGGDYILKVENRDNITIQNVNFSSSAKGLLVDPSSNITLDNLAFIGNTLGLNMTDVNRSTISNSTFLYNQLGFYANNVSLSDITRNTFQDNISLFVENEGADLLTAVWLNNFRDWDGATPAGVDDAGDLFTYTQNPTYSGTNLTEGNFYDANIAVANRGWDDVGDMNMTFNNSLLLDRIDGMLVFQINWTKQSSVTSPHYYLEYSNGTQLFPLAEYGLADTFRNTTGSFTTTTFDFTARPWILFNVTIPAAANVTYGELVFNNHTEELIVDAGVDGIVNFNHTGNASTRSLIANNLTAGIRAAVASCTAGLSGLCNVTVNISGKNLTELTGIGIRYSNYYWDTTGITDTVTAIRITPYDGAVNGTYQEVKLFECYDGVDNDGDGRIDYPFDAGCIGYTDDDEFNATVFQCSDGGDNDSDTFTDFLEDCSCIDAADDDESDLVTPGSTQCSDGVDNDGDGDIDAQHDDGCVNLCDDSEGPDPLIPAECSDGLDNDGDNTCDTGGCLINGVFLFGDPQCNGPNDDDESGSDVFQCNDGWDNDSDTFTDWLEDPGCLGSPGWDNETNYGVKPECADGKDNDSDGGIDHVSQQPLVPPNPPDYGCFAAGDTSEAGPPFTFDNTTALQQCQWGPLDTNITIELNATKDAVNLNATYYCIDSVYGLDPLGSCYPGNGVRVDATDDVTFLTLVNVSCDTDPCQKVVRYFSMADDGENESIKYSNLLSFSAGNFQNACLDNSTVDPECIVVDSNIIDSTVEINSAYPTPCVINQSIIEQSHLVSTTAYKSFIDPTTVINSYIRNSEVTDSYVFTSDVDYATFCGEFNVTDAGIYNDTLIAGRIVYNAYSYYAPFNLTNICAGVPPRADGQLTANDTIVKNGTMVLFTYTGDVGYVVVLNASDLRNNETTQLIGSGGQYSAIVQVNNTGDQVVTVTAVVNDQVGNTLNVTTHVTVDNTPPLAGITINGGDLNTSSAYVRLNLSFSDANGVASCQYSTDGVAFSTQEACVSEKVLALPSGDGNVTVWCRVFDNAGNNVTVNDSIILAESVSVINITYPEAGDYAYSVINVTFNSSINNSPEISIDGGAWTSTTDWNYSTLDTTTLQDGAHTVQVRDVNNASMYGYSNIVTFYVNNTGLITITKPAPNQKVWGAINVTFDSSLNNSPEIAYDGGAWETTTDWNYSTLDTLARGMFDGTHTVQVRDQNAAGDYWYSPIVAFFINNTVFLNITYPLAGQEVNGTFDITFTTSFNNSPEISFDGGPWNATDTNISENWNTTLLADGAHTIQIRDNNDAGDMFYSNALVIYIRNAGALNITDPIPGSIVRGVVVINFTNPISNIAEISIDGASWILANLTNYTWNTLDYGEGAHTVQVRDITTAGDYGYSQTVTYEVDNAPGGVTLLTPRTDNHVRLAVPVDATAPDWALRVEYLIENTSGTYALDGTAGSSIDTNGSDGWEQSWDTTLIGDGEYNVSVRAYERCFFIFSCFIAQDTAYNIEVDNTPPNFTIDAIPALVHTMMPVNTSNVANDTVSISFEYSMDNSTFYGLRYLDEDSVNWSFVWDMSHVEFNKNHTLRATATDEVGNKYTAYSGWFNITYPILDPTPPTLPTVYDGLEADDIDWLQDNTSLSAHWFGSIEDISNYILYEYRIRNGTGASDCFYPTDCSFIDVQQDLSVTVTGLSVLNGTNYSFDVIARNPFDVRSGIAHSDGAFLDITPPTAPNITSPTHPNYLVDYTINDVWLSWIAYDNVTGVVESDIQGYSYILDKDPNTAPDNTLESRATLIVHELNNNGASQVLRDNESGGSEDVFSVFSELRHNFTAGQIVDIELALIERVSETTNLTDITVYLATHGYTDDETTMTFELSTNITNKVNLSEDVAYRTGGPASALTYPVQLTINQDANSSTTGDTIYLVIAGNAPNTLSNNVSIAGTTNTDSDVRTFLCDISDCYNTTANITYAIEVSTIDAGAYWDRQYFNLADGTYFFHVKAQDNAGNFGPQGVFNFTINAAGPAVEIIQPFDGQIFTSGASAINITVQVSVDENSTMYVVAQHADGSTYNTSNKTFVGTGQFVDVTIENGTTELYVIAENELNVTVHSASVYVQLLPPGSVTGDKVLSVCYDGLTIGGYNQLGYAPTAGAMLGIASETGNSVTCDGSYAGMQADTSQNTIKIFFTQPPDFEEINTLLEEDEFLDLVNPSFGFTEGIDHYLIRTELRYEQVYLSGDQHVQAGKHDIIIRNNGVLPDGRINVTIVIQ